MRKSMGGSKAHAFPPRGGGDMYHTNARAKLTTNTEVPIPRLFFLSSEIYKER